jgi:hypothetical protein
MHRCLVSSVLLGSASLSAAPFLAIGDSSELFLTATTGVRFEDNVLLTENNQLDDVALEFTPGIELVFGKGSLYSGSFAVQEKFTEYLDNDSLSSNLSAYIFNSTYAGSKLKGSFGASFREIEQNNRNIANAATLTRRDVSNVSVKGELAITEKSKVGAAVTYGDTNYRTAGFNDTASYSVPVNYYFAITPKVDLSAGVRYRETEITGASDYTDIYYNVGARGDFTSKLTGSFTVGLTERDPEVGADRSMLGLDFDLSYAFSPKTVGKLTVGNDFDSSSAGGTSQEVFNVGLSANTQVSANFSAGASLSYQNADYSTGREDDFITLGLNASYVFNQHITGVVAYSYQDNDSTVAGGSFKANVLSVSAVFRY